MHKILFCFCGFISNFPNFPLVKSRFVKAIFFQFLQIYITTAKNLFLYMYMVSFSDMKFPKILQKTLL